MIEAAPSARPCAARTVAAADPSSGAPFNRREHARYAVGGAIQVKNNGANAWDGHCTDLSTGGFRFETLAYIDVEKPIYLLIEGLQPLRADVRWQDGRAFGCAFERPLYEPVFQHLLARLTPEPEPEAD